MNTKDLESKPKQGGGELKRSPVLKVSNFNFSLLLEFDQFFHLLFSYFFQAVKPHIPMIKFRKGGLMSNVSAAITETVAPAAAATQGPASTGIFSSREEITTACI